MEEYRGVGTVKSGVVGAENKTRREHAN